MSDQANNLSGKIGLDSSDFKTGIAALNREIRVIESGFRASAAALGDWGKDATGLEMRIGALTNKIGVQEKVAKALKDEYERLREENGENAISTQQALIKYNQATESLGKMQSELGETRTKLDEMGKESGETSGQVDQVTKSQDEAAKSGLNWKGVLGGLGGVLKGATVLVAGLAGAAAAAVGAMGGLVLKGADMAGELVDMSLKTGIGVERLQELQYIGDQVGTGLDTITGSLARMIRSMSDVGTSKEITAAFEKLGVNAKDANGNLRDSETVFGELLTALGNVENETERDALALEIFGRSAMELNPLIKAGADEINRLGDEAHKTGAVVDGETVGALESFGDKLAGLKAGLTGTLATLAGAFLPGLEGVTGQLQGYLSEFAGIVSGSGGDLGKMAGGVGGLLGKIIGDVAQQGPQMLQAGLGIIQGLIDAIVTQIPVILPAAISMITSLVDFIIQNLPMVMDAAVQILLALVNGIGGQLPKLIGAAIEMIVTLAEGLSKALPQLIPAIAEIIPQVVITLIDNLPLLIDAALELIMAIVDGLVVALPILIDYTPKILQAMFDAIVKALPKIGEAAVKIYWKLVDTLGEKLPELGQKAGEIVGVIGKGITDVLSKLWEVGGDIVNGIWSGIEAKRDYFKGQIQAFFKGIVDGVKKVLGIESPSKVFAGIGENMALGLGEGFDEAMKGVAKNIEGVVLPGIPNPTYPLAPSLKGRGSGGTVTVNVYATVANGVDVTSLAYRVAEVIQRRG